MIAKTLQDLPWHGPGNGGAVGTVSDDRGEAGRADDDVVREG